ncbi:rho family-interacting cell polarization regulator 1 isoform X2 [Lingula anatina]|uniref:Rho family-interacting cell polarization regulator 1 isoform X2 n=1 Tax=Lingula anatina TaxID=7574 RepID=A0A1S3JF11_LINAN|nr:rho family-interacting cell polarization regulator 1 isoform X2 [Lingula anatina]|eukprot:XP_013409002.1 rho family-interacting cell polarization regulator 1 isoform X2 [Lingula anatina]
MYLKINERDKHYGSVMALNDSHHKMADSNLQRSISFAGMLNQPVLGETLRSPRLQRKHIFKSTTNLSQSFRKLPNMPKVPRPNRTVVIFESIRKGLRDCIAATEEDVQSLRNKSEEITNSSSAQQIKSAERYKKRLEFHLAKIEELHEQYHVQLRLRDGARHMARAFISSPGKQKEHLANVKLGFKECNQNMCAIEAQLESVMGAFHCRIKGMVGFARLCPGDVFDITIRHGSQKWKAKGKINKSSQQKWEHGNTMFKCLLGHVFTVKAEEVHTLSRNTLLGEKHCDTKDLFAANPQLMTVNLNQIGSLKLSLIISWNPLDGAEDIGGGWSGLPRVHVNAARAQKASSVMVLTGDDGRLTDWRFSPDKHSLGTNSSSSSSSSSPTRRVGRPVSEFVSTDRLNRLGDNAYGKNKFLGEGSHDRSLVFVPNRFSVPVEMRPHDDSLIIGNRHSICGDVVVHSEPTSPATSDYKKLPLDEASSSKTEIKRRSSHQEKHSQDGSSKQDRPRPKSEIFLSSQEPVGTERVAKPKLFDMRLLSETTGMHLSPHEEVPRTLEQALNAIKTTLEDYQGQYPALRHLEEQISRLEEMLAKQKRMSRSRSPSVHSISIESALEAFDFLDLEEEGNQEDWDSPSRRSTSRKSSRGSLEDKPLISPESTTTTADSGIESLAHRLSEDRQFAGAGTSPEPASTGNDAVDVCLMFHLIYCDRLFNNLGKFGPLKCRETYSLDHLQMQGKIIEKLLDIAKAGKHVANIEKVMSEVTSNPRLKEFWQKSVDHSGLYVNSERFLAQLERSYGERIRDKFDIVASKVFRKTLAKILDMPSYDPDSNANVTLHQFLSFFSEDSRPSVAEYVEDLATELWMCGKLRSTDPDVVIKTIQAFQYDVPPTECIKLLTLLLISNNSEIKQTTVTYLQRLSSDRMSRDQVMKVFIEALEDHNADIRCGACVALSALRASETIEQLVYVCETDTSIVVKKSAKEAVFSFGEAGRRAYEAASLHTHGFQGIDVKHNHSGIKA